MRKIGNVLLILAGIFAILGCLGALGGSIALIVFSGPQFKQMIIDGLANGTIKSDLPGTPEEIATGVQAIFLGVGIFLAVEVLFTFGCAAVSFAAKAKQTSGLYIANIVLGVLTGSIFALVGGIFGLIGKEEI